jgi:hypothetical protein
LLSRSSIPPALAVTLALFSGCSGSLFTLARVRRPPIDRSLLIDRLARGDNGRGEGLFRPRCGEPRKRDADQSWRFVAPETGAYRFRVFAEHAAVAAVFHRDGWGEEIACAEQGPRDEFAEVRATLDGRAEYIVTVDGVRGEGGPYRLLAERDRGQRDPPRPASAESPSALLERCQRAPLLSPGIVQGAVQPGASIARVSCGGGGRGPESVYRLRLERDALVELTVHAAFDTVLELRSGCSASATVIACNDDAPDARRSQLRTPVPAGEYFVLIDSFSLARWMRSGTRVPAGEYFVLIDSFWEHGEGAFELSLSVEHPGERSTLEAPPSAARDASSITTDAR